MQIKTFYSFKCVPSISNKSWMNGLPLEGSNMMLHLSTFARSRGKCLKPRAKPEVFNTMQGPLEWSL